MSVSTAALEARANRWSQLWLGVVCMVLIANLQYGWTLFVNPMHNARGWALGDIQLAFAIFIATETWLSQSKAGSSTISVRVAGRRS
jgi:OFA family oxalate/formate antiporter-like MFS transporter